MKNKTIIGLCLSSVLALTPLTLVGCGNNVSMEDYQKELNSIIAMTKNSGAFASKTISFRNQGSYVGYAPSYITFLSNKINNKIATSIDDYVEVAEEYDFIVAYCIDALDFTNTKLGDFIKADKTYDSQQNINDLNDQLSELRRATAKQENHVNSLNNYIESLTASEASSFASAAIYNYKNDYSDYVREILDVAINNIDLLDSYAHITYNAKELITNEKATDVVLYQRILFIQENLLVLDSYFRLLVEEVDSKTPEQFDSTNENLKGIISDLSTVKTNYEKYIAKIASKSTSEVYNNVISQTDKAELQINKEIFKQEKEIVDSHLEDFNMYGLVYTNNGDLSKISKKQRFDYEQIMNYYDNTLQTWTNYYLPYFA